MKPKPKRIALIGLPVLQSVNNLSNHAIASHAEQSRRWKFVFSAEASVAAFRFLRSLECDGAIVRVTSKAMLREARRVRFPLVNLSSWLEEPIVPTVRHDYAAAGRLAASHLLEKGFRRFGCVVVPGGWYIEQRHRAFLEAVRAGGGEVTNFSLRTSQPHASEPIAPSERRRAAAWIRTLQRPAALVLTDDWDAPTLMGICREVGYEIPRDLVVLAMSFHSEVLPSCPVPLTAVQEDQQMQARLAVACLDGLMADGHSRELIIDVPPLGVVERASTATMAIEDREVAHTVEFIRAHGCEPINVADVCARVQVSRVTLERRFRHVMGVTLHDYLTQQRIARAKELLCAPDGLNLQQIALRCGLTDRRRLNQLFASVTGKTPAAWRRSALKPGAREGDAKVPGTDAT